MFCRKRYKNMDITIHELKNKVLQGAVLIDVRSNQEYKEGHIQGAINIPDFEIIKRIQQEVLKKNQLIVVYCQYGGRSKNAMTVLNKLGYTNVYNLYGGLEKI